MPRIPSPESQIPTLSLLHLCDSLFPIGGFGYSDGLEAATSLGAIADADSLRAWMDICLDETFGRMDGPAVWQAWQAIGDRRWEAIALLDAELHALRPSSSARRSNRAMGQRLLATWRTLHPDPRLDQASQAVGHGKGIALPIAFGAACLCAGIGRRAAVEAFAYTRASATISAAMRLMPIGQTAAHGVLARTLERVPGIVSGVIERGGRLESFTPALDIALISQQYLHSRLFRS